MSFLLMCFVCARQSGGWSDEGVIMGRITPNAPFGLPGSKEAVEDFLAVRVERAAVADQVLDAVYGTLPGNAGPDYPEK